MSSQIVSLFLYVPSEEVWGQAQQIFLRMNCTELKVQAQNGRRQICMRLLSLSCDSVTSGTGVVDAHVVWRKGRRIGTNCGRWANHLRNIHQVPRLVCGCHGQPQETCKVPNEPRKKGAKSFAIQSSAYGSLIYIYNMFQALYMSIVFSTEVHVYHSELSDLISHRTLLLGLQMTRRAIVSSQATLVTLVPLVAAIL